MSRAAAPAGGSAGRLPYRMKDLCDHTGLSRQAIHFYIQQGLVPEGHKTGRNMAWYGEEHVRRLELIRKLQHEQFLPLRVIRALLGGETSGFDARQRLVLAEVRSRLAPRLSTDRAGGDGGVGGPERLDAEQVARRSAVGSADLQRMAALGLITLHESDGAGPALDAGDARLVELWGEFRKIGFTEELGFSVDDLQMYTEPVKRMFEREAELVLERLSDLPPDHVAGMMERVLPLVHAFLAHYHTARVSGFLAAAE